MGLGLGLGLGLGFTSVLAYASKTSKKIVRKRNSTVFVMKGGDFVGGTSSAGGAQHRLGLGYLAPYIVIIFFGICS